ncbi:NAD(P)-dependent oxidoreductase [Aeromicrobium panaciterrae]|uniref:SDR family oxidoreductase n=1 Tax=Aeromicrobium panaciterrae TaxID=363861 RepID=UPI0031D31ACE
MTEHQNSRRLDGQVIVMSGGSRGIGLSILCAAAARGANAVILAKTDQPDHRLPGTVHTAVQQVREAGGEAVAVVGDVRRDEDVQRAAATAIETFGQIDIVVNNASAISKADTSEISMKQFDLMQDINVRGTFALTQACLPALTASPHGRILTLSPPLNLADHWMGRHPAYTMTKYAMTLLTLGWAAELKDRGIDAYCLWPQTRIATAVIQNLLGGEEALARSRDPQIMADAAVQLFTALPGELSGRTLIDAEVLAATGEIDLSKYGGGDDPVLDLYVDPA